ncbi:hypothetical protein DQP57_00410 [Mycobacterium colombiense]|uniref:Uncharacterized protein n=1 Tax=Mycobacterium colombiense TaxID=339268 RepID=A0A329MC02_9MYCO|nr:hypothetical protein [Mycobacterium colombiense]RAV17521.1 hypothetical protein DQP57_00410 [Mycobacterium colombiense]
MSARLYVAYNAVTTALTAPMAATATSASTSTPKTILQIAPGSHIQVIEAGYMFTSVPSAPVTMELIETGSVFATVTAGSISNYNAPTGQASAATTGTSATGFNATNEGSITATRLLAMTVDQSFYQKQQFPLDREPEVESGKSLRIRATPGSAAAVNVICYVIWAE